MSSRASLNKVLLIGNLTRDPELRYTPSGAAVCTFGVATNRSYTASDGTKKDEAEFIKIVAWGKLGELCSQLLKKGRKIYCEGRLQTRSWETPDGQQRQTTEVVIDDMRILDSRRDFFPEGEGTGVPDADFNAAPGRAIPEPPNIDLEETQPSGDKGAKAPAKKAGDTKSEDKVDLDDLPF